MSALVRQATRFGLVGVVNTTIGLLVIIAAKSFVGLGDIAANATGYGFGLMLSFLLNRSWTFGHGGNLGWPAVRFGAAFVIAYASNLTTMIALRDLAEIDAYIAQAMSVIPYTLVFFLLNRWFVFARPSA